MKQLSFILDNYLRGKATYGPVRRIVDILLSVSIASFLFETFYFKYQLMDVSDYKSIIHFFVKGYFIVPLLLFLAAHYITYFISYSFFTLSTTKKSTKWITGIVKFKLKKKDMESLTRKMNKNGVVEMPVKFEPSWIAQTYIALKASVQPEQWKNAETMLNKQMQNIERNFTLLFKALVAISIFYFATVPHLGLFLYIASMAVSTALMIMLWYTYLVLYVLPTIVRKIDFELQQHLASEAVANEQAS
jgi:hypothetical protein